MLLCMKCIFSWSNQYYSCSNVRNTSVHGSSTSSYAKKLWFTTWWWPSVKASEVLHDLKKSTRWHWLQTSRLFYNKWFKRFASSVLARSFYSESRNKHVWNRRGIADRNVFFLVFVIIARYKGVKFAFEFYLHIFVDFRVASGYIRSRMLYLMKLYDRAFHLLLRG